MTQEVSLSNSQAVEIQHLETIEQQIAANETALAQIAINRAARREADRHDREAERLLRSDNAMLRKKHRIFDYAAFRLRQVDKGL